MEEIKPCPFCGNSGKILTTQTDPIKYYVFCNTCFTDGPEALEIKIALKLWNGAKR